MTEINYPHTLKCAANKDDTKECTCMRRLTYTRSAPGILIARDIASCGFNVDVMPVGYYVRIHLMDSYYPAYDWYFTKTGSLCVVRDENSPPRSCGRFETPESVVEFINKHEKEFN